jgi:exopolysaccharide production protein ExoY
LDIAFGTRQREQQWVYPTVKRLVDISLAIVALAGLLWLIVAVALVVKITSRGPVLYAQMRVGRDGRLFRCWKFRTMVANADAWLAERPNIRQEFEKNFKLANDPRVTRVGQVLRSSSIDELPQLWNIIRGDMSLVGPRPVLPVELERMYGSSAPILLSVLPGLTGLWQVCGRSTLTYAERMRLDLAYVRQRSVLFDLQIIARTPLALVRTGAAH